MNYTHFIVRTYALKPSPDRINQIEHLFGAVRTFHNAVVGKMDGMSQMQICYGLSGTFDSDRERYNTHTLPAIFKEQHVYGLNVDNGIAEIISQAHPSILETHSSLISNSWAEYALGRRRRPSFKDRNATQSFWVTEVDAIQASGDIPQLWTPFNEDISAIYLSDIDDFPYGYRMTTYRLTKLNGNYVLNCLFEKKMALEEVSAIYEEAGTPKAFILVKWGLEVSENEARIASPRLNEEANSRELMNSKEDLARIRRHALNRLSKKNNQYRHDYHEERDYHEETCC